MIRSPRRLEKIRAVLARRQPGLTIVMENIHDPHNVSAVFRTCDAVGVHRVELLYTREPFPKIGKKSSSSANKWLERRKHRSVNGCYSVLRDEGFRIFATRLTERTRSLYDLDLTGKVAFVFGNEHRGVSDEAAEMADENFQIPMTGMIESLNVSVAAAVCLYEALRQRLRAGQYDRPALSADELLRFYDEWVKR
jgi:tRNA (guanosine-2'-O-)-methyltransferase